VLLSVVVSSREPLRRTTPRSSHRGAVSVLRTGAVDDNAERMRALVAPQTSLNHLAVRAAFVAVLGLVWASLFTYEPFGVVVAAVVDAARPRLPQLVGWSGWQHVLAPTAAVLGFALALLAFAVALHGPSRAGLAPPTPTGARLTWVALLVAAIVEVACAWGLVGARVDLAVARPMPWLWLGVDAALLVGEHFVAQGAVLALALPFGLPDADERRRTGLPGLRFLAGLGMGPVQDPRLPGPRTWLAVPVDAWPAIVAQAVVFALLRYVPVEAPLWMAVVGGVGAGWLTARTGSVWPAVIVRLATSHVPVAVVALVLHA